MSIPINLEQSALVEAEKAILARFSKDEARIAEFVAAVGARATQPFTGDQTLGKFLTASGELVAAWFHRATHLSFADIFHDPFHQLRQDTRVFAKTWELDPTFVEAMG